MKQQPLDAYFVALERLKQRVPTVVPKGTKITNDAVALEAGRGKGSIKKSRDVFSDLIIAIDEAAAEQAKPKNEKKVQLEKAKGTAHQLRRELEAALGREVSLLQELFETKQKLAKLTGGNVLPIRGLNSKGRMEHKAEIKEIIILIGIPASGKSTFYDTRLSKTHVRLSLDIVKSRFREMTLFKEYLAAKLSVVVDNTNVTTSDRNRYIEPAKAAGFQVKGFYFEADVKESLLRNELRVGKNKLPAVAIYTSNMKMELPRLDEGFDELYTVNLAPAGEFRISRWNLEKQ